MTLRQAIATYLCYLKTLGRSPYTVKGAKYGLADLVRFLDNEKVDHVERLTLDILKEYQEDLSFRVSNRGKLLSQRTQGQLLGVVKGFTKYLKESDYLVHDPGEKIKLPRKPKRLPKIILNDVEVRKMMNAPDTHTNRGYRNRIILELLYDTGIRRAEVANITLPDIDLDGGYILIHGKGNKERVVPLSERVCNLVRNYIIAIRPTFLQGNDLKYLILNRWGKKMDANGVWAVVKRCVTLSKIKKNITTHTFRHTCATHMLQHGAPVRHVQELLGHESLESTQIYTHVTINDLKKIHAKYHPSESMEM